MVDLMILNTRDAIHGHIPHPVPSCIVSRAVMHRIPCSSCIASRVHHVSYPVPSCIASRVHHASHPVFIMHHIPCSSCIASRAVMHRIPCRHASHPVPIFCVSSWPNSVSDWL